MTAALQLSGVVHRYDRVVAVDGVDLEVGPGEIVCLLGPSGCGKSTLLRVAAGLEHLQLGSIAIAGREVARGGGMSLPPEERAVGFMFQDFALFPHLSVLENIAFGLRRKSAPERREIARAALAQVGMDGFEAAYPHMLSGGQQQRVALARAIAPEPPLFLLDEPFSGLDARLRRRLAEDTWRLLKQTGAATVVVTHDPEEALFLGDRIAVMRGGRIEQIDDPSSIYTHPQNAFVADFLSEVNRWSVTVGTDGTIGTPFGPLPAPGCEPGQAAELLIRHDAIRTVDILPGLAESPETSCEAQVVYARHLGGSILLFLAVTDADGRTRRFYARRRGTVLPPDGARIAVSIDRSQAFVFPGAPPK